MIKNILTIGGIGCLVFTAFILLMAYSGIASEMRDEEGNFKKKRNLKTVLGALLFISFLFGTLFAGNLCLIHAAEESPGFLLLYFNSFGIFLLIHLYDLIVLDLFIIVTWHPKFLKLPDTNYYTTSKPHLIGFAKGIPLGMVASLITSTINMGIMSL